MAGLAFHMNSIKAHIGTGLQFGFSGEFSKSFMWNWFTVWLFRWVWYLGGGCVRLG